MFRLLHWLVGLGTAVAAILGFVIASANPSEIEVILALLTIALVTPVFMRIIRGKFDPFEPLFLFVLAYGVMFVLAPGAAYFTDRLWYDRLNQWMDIQDGLPEVLKLALIGAVSYIGMYSLVLSRLPTIQPISFGKNFVVHRIALLALGLATTGLVLYAGFLQSAGGFDALRLLLSGKDPAQRGLYKGSTGYLYMGPDLLIPASLLLMGIGIYTERRRYVVSGGVLTLFLVLRAIPSGGRMALLTAVISAVILFYLLRNRRPSRTIVIGSLVVGVVLSAFFVNVRSFDNREDMTIGEIFVESVIRPGAAVNRLLFSADVEMTSAFAAIYPRVHEDLGIGWGARSVGDIFFRPIPRVIWEDKPLPSRELVLDTYWHAGYQAGAANMEFSVLMYFFWDLGAFGVALGMGVFGAIAGWLYRLLLANKHNLFILMLYSAMLPMTIIGLRDSPVDTIIRFVFIAFPIVIVFTVESVIRGSSQAFTYGSHSSDQRAIAIGPNGS